MPYRYCPLCATALTPFDETAYRRRCPACGWLHWGNPRPTVCGLVEREGAEGMELLLVRRAIEPFQGCWDVPGGFVELFEEAEAALRRELREEANVEIGTPRLLGVWNDAYPYSSGVERTLNLVFAASWTGGEPRAGDDACDVAWFPVRALPPDTEVAFESGVAALHAWRADALARQR